MPFTTYYAAKGIAVDNRAIGGSSTRDWVASYWASVQSVLKTGDYVFIDLGHNDEGQSVPTTEYVSNLKIMVTQARAKGAIPVLVTPTTRRRFDSSGNVLETHPRTGAAMRTLASSIGVALIDLDSLSRVLVQSYGVEGSKPLYLCTKPGQYPYYPNGGSDNTHLQVLGAQDV